MIFDRDKFLTEAMGECWHESKQYSLDNMCQKCFKNLPFDPDKRNNNFSTWDSFGKLLWCKVQAWFVDFLYKNRIDIRYVNPDKLADAVYDYLKHTANALSMEEIGEVLYK